ncbi:hypothetical protein ScPMuIL_003338 [Solemya velum]
MASQRPRRKQRTTKGFEYDGQVTRWTSTEKRQLLKAIKQYDPEDYEKLLEQVPTKSVKEIELYISKLKNTIQTKTQKTAAAPIEKWHSMASDLINIEEEDHSVLLSKVLSLIAKYDDHPPKGENQPDYTNIYSYLSALLSKDEKLPELGPLESGIILDLLHSLVDVLSASDTTRQVQVMKWKYQLISTKVDLSKPNLNVRQGIKAMQNDFSDFETTPGINKEGVTDTDTNPQSITDSDSTINIQSRSQTGDSNGITDSGTSSQIDVDVSITNSQNQSHRSDIVSATNDATSSTTEYSNSTTYNQTQTQTGDLVSNTNSNSQKKDSNPIATNLESQCSASDVSDSLFQSKEPQCTTVLCLENSEAKESAINVISESRNSINQPRVSQTDGITTIDIEASDPQTTNSSDKITGSSVPQDSVSEPQSSQARVSNPCGSQAAEKTSKEELPKPKKKRGRKKKNPCEEIIFPKKPRLYALNPFCIPVKFVKLKPKNS